VQKIDIDKKTTLDVKCKVKHLSFSAHADAKGIMQMIRQVEPRNVMLVHGERSKMYVSHLLMLMHSIAS
jgi:integrator complex subunit 11